MSFPGLLGSYLRALAPCRGSGWAPGDPLPEIADNDDEFHLDEARIRAYAAVCGLPMPGAATVPILYPMVASFRQQLDLLTRPDWPLRAMGLIHLGVDIEQVRPLPIARPLRLSCGLSGEARTSRGHEFTLKLSVEDELGVAWTGHSHVLSRQKGERRASAREAEPEAEAKAWRLRGLMEATTVTARHYAHVSDDWNPIHLGVVSARLLGLPRPIAHGMWTLARGLAALDRAVATTPTAVHCRFRAPFQLPGRAEVYAWEEADMLGLEIRIRDGIRPVLQAHIQELT